VQKAMDRKPELKPEVLSWIEESSHYPTDENGYLIGFDPFLESDLVVDAFNSFGFVVISNVISSNAIKDYTTRINILHKSLANKKDKSGIKAIDNGFIEIYHDDFLAKARASYRFYTGHSLIWKTSRLWCTYDRISYKSNTDLPNYSTSLHVNQNPLKHPKVSYTQGYISLVEEPKDNGNMRFVVNSQRYFDAWRPFAKSDTQFLNLNVEHNPYLSHLELNAVPIAVRPGDGIIWDARLVHSSTINKHTTPRISILMSYMPAILQDNIRQKRIDCYVSGSPEINRSARLNASQEPRFDEPKVIKKLRITEELDRFGRLLYGLEGY
jgi:ectoine hydroxylase-related dioxygenase (phytanoyl-CoA dioxygenase family)